MDQEFCGYPRTANQDQSKHKTLKILTDSSHALDAVSHHIKVTDSFKESQRALDLDFYNFLTEMQETLPCCSCSPPSLVRKVKV